MCCIDVSDRSLKAGGADRKSAKVAPSSFGSKSDERAEKRKEVPIGPIFSSLSIKDISFDNAFDILNIQFFTISQLNLWSLK